MAYLDIGDNGPAGFGSNVTKMGWSTNYLNPIGMSQAQVGTQLAARMGGQRVVTSYDQWGHPVSRYQDYSPASSLSSISGGGYSGLKDFAEGINPTMGANRFEAGLSGMENRLIGLLDDPTKIKETAAYKFRTGQGEQALNRQMAAKGMLGSGNRLMDLMKYGQDMASQEYDAQLGRLQGLVGTYGQNWNQAQGTNVNQYLGEMGQKRNALSDMLTGELKSTEIENKFLSDSLNAISKTWGR